MSETFAQQEFYETSGKLQVNAQGEQIYDLISNDLMKRLIMPTTEQEDEAGRQKALLDTGWFFEQWIL